jgi:hypothetical protein
MPGISVARLAGQMLGALKQPLLDKAPEIKDYAKTEFKKIAETIAFIEREHLAGRMSRKKAKLHLDMQKNAAKSVMLTIEGLGLLAVENAINDALKLVRDTVNTALGFKLI